MSGTIKAPLRARAIADALDITRLSGTVEATLAATAVRCGRMLAAPSDRRYGPSRIRSVLTLERRFRAHLVVREQLVFDSRFAAAAVGGPIATVYVMLEGWFQVAGFPVIRAPVAFVMAETEFERVIPGALTFRSWGDPSVTIEVRVPLTDVRVPVGLAHGPRPVSPSTLDALRRGRDALIAGESTDAATLDLVRCLAHDGLIKPDIADSVTLVEAESLARVWSAATPVVAGLATAASIFGVAKTAGLSIRQLSRDIKVFAKTFGLPGEGFRDTMKVMRLRAAMILLSAPGATATDVAREVGYQSLEAMGRALREADLPAPSVIRDHVAYAAMPTPA